MTDPIKLTKKIDSTLLSELSQFMGQKVSITIEPVEDDSINERLLNFQESVKQMKMNPLSLEEIDSLNDLQKEIFTRRASEEPRNLDF